MNKLREVSIYGFVILLQLISGCITEPNYSNEYVNSIENALKHFPDTLLKHFPRNLDDPFQFIITNPDICNKDNRCGVTLVVNCDEKNLRIIEENLKSKSIFHLKYFDNCNLVVNAKQSKSDCNIYLDSIRLNCHTTSPPIPNFPKVLNEIKILTETDSIIISEFEIFLLNASPGVYIDSSNLSNGRCLPEEWRNGFSNGIAINTEKNQILYWLEIW